MKYKIQQILKMKSFQADKDCAPQCSAKLSIILQIFVLKQYTTINFSKIQDIQPENEMTISYISSLISDIRLLGYFKVLYCR